MELLEVCRMIAAELFHHAVLGRVVDEPFLQNGHK
jgi:hypothetical protein